MKFTLTIDCDNAAFAVEDAAFDGVISGSEIARILTKLAKDDLVDGTLAAPDAGPLYDTNGNRVGGWVIND